MAKMDLFNSIPVVKTRAISLVLPQEIHDKYPDAIMKIEDDLNSLRDANWEMLVCNKYWDFDSHLLKMRNRVTALRLQFIFVSVATDKEDVLRNPSNDYYFIHEVTGEQDLLDLIPNAELQWNKVDHSDLDVFDDPSMYEDSEFKHASTATKEQALYMLGFRQPHAIKVVHFTQHGEVFDHPGGTLIDTVRVPVWSVIDPNNPNDWKEEVAIFPIGAEDGDTSKSLLVDTITSATYTSTNLTIYYKENQNLSEGKFILVSGNAGNSYKFNRVSNETLEARRVAALKTAGNEVLIVDKTLIADYCHKRNKKVVSQVVDGKIRYFYENIITSQDKEEVDNFTISDLAREFLIPETPWDVMVHFQNKQSIDIGWVYPAKREEYLARLKSNNTRL